MVPPWRPIIRARWLCFPGLAADWCLPPGLLPRDWRLDFPGPFPARGFPRHGALFAGGVSTPARFTPGGPPWGLLSLVGLFSPPVLPWPVVPPPAAFFWGASLTPNRRLGPRIGVSPTVAYYPGWVCFSPGQGPGGASPYSYFPPFWASHFTAAPPNRPVVPPQAQSLLGLDPLNCLVGPQWCLPRGLLSPGVGSDPRAPAPGGSLPYSGFNPPFGVPRLPGFASSRRVLPYGAIIPCWRLTSPRPSPPGCPATLLVGLPPFGVRLRGKAPRPPGPGFLRSLPFPGVAPFSLFGRLTSPPPSVPPWVVPPWPIIPCWASPTSPDASVAAGVVPPLRRPIIPPGWRLDFPGPPLSAGGPPWAYYARLASVFPAPPRVPRKWSPPGAPIIRAVGV